MFHSLRIRYCDHDFLANELGKVEYHRYGHLRD